MTAKYGWSHTARDFAALYYVLMKIYACIQALSFILFLCEVANLLVGCVGFEKSY